MAVNEREKWWVRAKFEYNPQMLAWLKGLPGSEGSYRNGDKTWRIPVECVSLLFKEAKKHGIEVDVSLPGSCSEASFREPSLSAHLKF